MSLGPRPVRKNFSGRREGDLVRTIGVPRIRNNTKYLGLPLFHTRRKSHDFNYILDKLESLLSGWKSKLLSKAGRLMMIKSVGLAIPTYTMQSIPIPLQLCNKIDAALRKFWWGHKSENNRGLCLKSWGNLCKPKSHRGLGLCQSHDINKALLGKWGWGLLTNANSLCLQILRAKYLHHSSFIDSEPRNGDSWTWKGICSSKPLITKGACKQLGNRKSINIWIDPWLPQFPGFRPPPTGNLRLGLIFLDDFRLPTGG
ncbi:hypothetical protein TorRG33x02_253580 [Trema orientale]|uniref:Uncharacterized protein n=1 Tax=Trema orientale TaxID=63057 RepID=A0A2P5DEM9_TREOI|nr:hypothetical protein TorRG33x02_253580 [Trema orientale]